MEREPVARRTSHPVKCLVPRAITPEVEAFLKSTAQASAHSWATTNRDALYTAMDPWISSRSEDYQIAHDGLEAACRPPPSAARILCTGPLPRLVLHNRPLPPDLRRRNALAWVHGESFRHHAF